MTVILRSKQLKNNRVSFYLDIYHNRERYYEFLKIYVNNKSSEGDKAKRRLAEEIRSKREYELIVLDNGLFDKHRREDDFIVFFSEYIKSKHHNANYRTTLGWLKNFTAKQFLPIRQVTAKWMKTFEAYLLKSVSDNTALSYLGNVSAALNELVRRQIISCNPWYTIPSHERLRRKEITHTAWTLEQLQQLADTPCNIKLQFKQAYFFACFTGLRWGDVNCLKWSNIVRKTIQCQEEYFIHFEQGKTGGVEYFPLSGQAIDILKDRMRENEDKSLFVFPSVNGADPINKDVQARIDYALKKWAQAAGLEKKRMRFHTGRHTYATNILELTNSSLYTVSKLLGHKSIQSTQIYAHVSDRVKYVVVKSLPKINFDLN